jgi:excisionase family DNA binding protein
MTNKQENTINLDTLPPAIPVATAANMLAVHAATIRNMCRKGSIKAVKVGTDWRINTAAFRAQFGI